MRNRREREHYTLFIRSSLSSEPSVIFCCFCWEHHCLWWWMVLLVLMWPMLVCVSSCLRRAPSFSPCSWGTTAPSPLSIETLSPISSPSSSASSLESSSFRYYLHTSFKCTEIQCMTYLEHKHVHIQHLWCCQPQLCSILQGILVSRLTLVWPYCHHCLHL